MKLLFVCLGNICRSPTAEGVFRVLAGRDAPGLIAEIDSAGTADYHIGAAPDPRSQFAASARGYDLSALRARQVTATDFSQFDLILAMDRSNLANLRAVAPPAALPRLVLLLDYITYLGPREVPDPYHGNSRDFDAVVTLLEEASLALIQRLSSNG